jgi:hypothetical protein
MKEVYVVAYTSVNNKLGSKMKKHSLYVKTHNVTGLKYLGQTSKFDPHRYAGSGKYWLRHLKKHGNNWTTKILCESENKQKINEMGIYYSNLWNVVENNNWANLKPESGDGAASGSYNPMQNPKIFAKQQAIISDPQIKDKHRQATIKAMNNPLVKAKLKAQRNTLEYKARLKHTLHKPEIVNNRFGDKNPNFDPTVYEFTHDSGEKFIGTRFDFDQNYKLTSGSVSRLLNGKYQSTQGWRLANSVGNTDKAVYNNLVGSI